MGVSVRIQLNQRQIDRILRSPNGLTAHNMLRRGRRVKRHAQRNVNSRTGRLAGSIEVRRAYFAGAPGCEVYTNVHYALYVHEGTRTPIRARRGGYLRIQFPDAVVYRRWVRGQSANPFLRNALNSAV